MFNLKPDLEKFLVILIIVNFLVIVFPLFQFPLPQNLYPDSAQHYTMIELIKEDFKWVNYNPGYRKAFHLMSAVVSNFTSVGIAMALVTSFFVALLIFFSFKLALLLSNDRLVSLFTALLVSGITIVSDVGSIPSPVPQTIGLSLGIISMYYFFKEDWKATGIAIGLYALTHTSFLYFIALMALASVTELFKDNKLNKLVTFAKSFSVVLVVVVLTAFLSLSAKISFFDVSPKIAILGHVSPLSFLDVTAPFGIILVAFFSVFYFRKKIFEELNHFIVFLWLVSPILFSQIYWLELQWFPTQRTLIFMLFPLAFFSAEAVSLIKNKKILFVLSAVFLLFSFFSHFYFYEEMPKNDFKKVVGKEDLEVINFLKEKPLDEIVVAENKYSYMIILSHKKLSSQRNFWFILVEKNMNKLLDLHDIKYFLIDKDNFENFEVIEGLEKEFENKEFVLLKVKKEVKPVKTDRLEDYVVALVAFWDPIRTTQSLEPKFFKITATDTKEEVCILVYDGLNVSPCPEKIDFEVSGKKETLVELMNSFNKEYFYLKAAYFIRKKELQVHPDEIDFLGEGPYHITYLAHTYSWVGGPEYSKPNLLIGKFFWDIGLNR
ncbi:MAG: hypothetical protein ABH986_03030 [archaeon]